MSVKDYNKILIVSDALNGDIITNIPFKEFYSFTTISSMLNDIIDDFCYDNEHGILIKVGYKN